MWTRFGNRLMAAGLVVATCSLNAVVVHGDQALDRLAAIERQFDQQLAARKYPEAERLGLELVRIADTSFRNQPAVIDICVSKLGQVYSETGRYAEAEPLFARSVKLAEKLYGRNDERYGRAIYNLGIIYRAQARFSEAETQVKRALEIYRATRDIDPLKIANALDNLGSVYYDQGQLERARPPLTEALQIRKAKLGSEHDLIALSYNNLGNLDKAEGLFFDAEQKFKESLRIYEKLYGPNDSSVALALTNLGNVYREQNREKEAQALHLRALSIREATLGPHNQFVGDSLVCLANVEVAQGQYVAAEAHFRRALEIYRSALPPNHPLIADLRNNLGWLYLTQSRFAQAEEQHKQALAIREQQFSESFAVSQSLSNLANVYKWQWRYREAEPLYLRSIQIREKIFGKNHAFMATPLDDLATLYLFQRRYAEAEALMLRALQITEQGTGYHVNGGSPTLLTNLAVLYNTLDRGNEAMPLLDRAISLAEQSGANPWASYSARSETLWKQGQTEAAIKDLNRSLDLAEEKRRQFSGSEHDRAQSFARFANNYETLLLWSREMANVDAAFSAAERSRSRTLLDQLAAQGTDLLEGVPPAESRKLQDEETRWQVRVAELEKQLQLASSTKDETKIQSLHSELRAARQNLVDAYIAIRNASPAYRLAVSKDQKPLALPELQAWLAESQSLLLQYYLGAKQGYLFIVPPSGEAKLVTLEVNADQAAKLGIEAGPLTAERLQGALVNEGRTGVFDLLQDEAKSSEAVPKLATLWQVLVPEAEREELTSDKYPQLFIVPDGPLSLIPFETLVVEEAAEPTYLLDVAPPIVHGPSAGILYNLAHRSSEQSSVRKPMLTVGDPAYREAAVQVAANDSSAELRTRSRYTTVGGDLGRLPHSAKETDYVESLCMKAQIPCRQLIGAQATEAKVRQQLVGCEFVHLACHGQADQEYGNFFGALALAPSTQRQINPLDDGFLSLPEIYALNLRGCELSILSACQTNYGPQQKGEGVWALSRGFLVAGSKRVVASNWLVDDLAAADLISYFCGGITQAIKQGKSPDYAKSLQSAKRFIRDKPEWKSPYFWGTFVLVGPN